MEAAGQQVTEAGTGRGARRARPGRSGAHRGAHRGALAGLIAGLGRSRAGVLALLREDEGLGTGRFLCLTCQGLEAEGRAAERLPRVPGDRAYSWSWCRGPEMLPFACPWPFLCSWAVPDLSLSLTCPCPSPHLRPRSWAAPARGAGPRTGALQSQRSALGTVATQLSQKFIKTLAGGGGVVGSGMAGESSKVRNVRFPETRCYSLPQREMT